MKDEKKKKLKKEKRKAKFWNEMIAVYFDFCRKVFLTDPSFDGSAPRDFQTIIFALEDRCVAAGVEWTLKEASNRLGRFLLSAHEDKWLRDNFLLQNLNRQKDKIFFKVNSNSSNGQRANSKTDGIEYAISQAIGGNKQSEL